MNDLFPCTCPTCGQPVQNGTVAQSRFNDFWAMLPRRVEKPKTQAAWNKLSRQDQELAAQNVKQWYDWFKAANPQASLLYPARYLKERRWEDEDFQDKPKAAPDRDAAIAMHRKALTSPSEAVRRNAQDQLRKLGETI